LAYGFTHVGKYNVELSAYNNGCKIGDTIREIIIKDCYPKLVNTFTPGTDGTNDRWEIKDIENFPNAQLVIFNRWGVIVKEYPRGYIEPWDGTNSEGQTLEEGTYYYVLNLNRIKGEKGIYRGYITIIRQK
jgi:gliding motility-associated-like protein